MLVQVKPGIGGIDTIYGIKFDWSPCTVHEVLCICADTRFLQLIGAPQSAMWPRDYFIEGAIDEVWLKCVDASVDVGLMPDLREGHIYPCINPQRWRTVGVASISLRPGYNYVATRFVEVPYPRMEPQGDTWREVTFGSAALEPHKAALVAFFKKPAHDDLCGSCGAPRPCKYHG